MKDDSGSYAVLTEQGSPERREAVRAQLEASVEPKYDSRVQFNSENARKTIVKVPPKFLNQQFLVRFAFAVEALKALFEKDRKILMRAATITKSYPFGTLFHAQWISWMQERVDLFCFSHTAIKYDEHFVIDWASSGHFSFQPPTPEECPPNEHRYTRIVKKEKSVTLGDDVVIKASWHVESHWDHMEAFAFNPEAKWRKEMCYKFFTDALLEELVWEQWIATQQNWEVVLDGAEAANKDRFTEMIDGSLRRAWSRTVRISLFPLLYFQRWVVLV